MICGVVYFAQLPLSINTTNVKNIYTIHINNLLDLQSVKQESALVKQILTHNVIT